MTAEFFIMIGILTGSLIILLKHWPLLLIQIIYQIVALNTTNLVFNLLVVIQIIFGIWVFYRTLRAVDYFYTLELDQIERIPQKYTKGGKLGQKKHFLF
ncbi:hypothetical protein SAMN04487944_1196 [Gracilibacillus ureilyticus]|uniref:Uncharacterized protein n=1 Tax=Gracilibacillus ureilyticus TaxID=531814 RepID=A0A1H9USC0_9BACI|nr:hypothetical protein [Gracilibacillus ureilyticus]SES12024.1 hypothetical protein SAMN04487944_1196 [Gracilibacillus ureilyticus]